MSGIYWHVNNKRDVVVRPASRISRPPNSYRPPACEPRQFRESRTPRHERKVFLGGLPKSTTEDDLLLHFGRYGEIQKATVVRNENGESRGFGYILFTEKDCMKKVLNPHFAHVVRGRELDVKCVQPLNAGITTRPDESDRVMINQFQGTAVKRPENGRAPRGVRQQGKDHRPPWDTGIKYDHWRLQQIELGIVREGEPEERPKSADLIHFDEPLIQL
ncbi:hypothetical protein QR680_000154 [Steinernema hermaphroditum]|uniref:RRM domain-containing protein n=1 Tax=Steinernema hermaphroditum TaxID=289476 RepID=A0AA39GTL0_9BILA|nr:hypothetical protein QR680_000154 [Steinernema hermaphroditum]